ncbi:hypothetical protein ASG80_14135 [Agromyces sp. Soil535]|nr:hypothetical protein ASG80_14135 [Agromyces sp. Soil535]
MGFEHRRHRPVGRDTDVEMGGHAAPGVIAKDVMRNGYDLDPISVEDCNAKVGERQDPGQQRQTDPTSRRLDACNLRLVEAECIAEITLTQIACPPHAHHESRHVDGRPFAADPTGTGPLGTDPLRPTLIRSDLIRPATIRPFFSHRLNSLRRSLSTRTDIGSHVRNDVIRRMTPALMPIRHQCRSLYGVAASERSLWTGAAAVPESVHGCGIRPESPQSEEVDRMVRESDVGRVAMWRVPMWRIPTWRASAAWAAATSRSVGSPLSGRRAARPRAECRR